METVREIWRAADDAMMGQYAIGSYTSVFRDPGCPRVGGLFDLVFTTERLVFVTAELQQDTTGQWVLGGAIAGPVGIAVLVASGPCGTRTRLRGIGVRSTPQCSIR